MTCLAAQLSSRVQILIPSQRPNDDGGFDLGFGVQASDAFAVSDFERLAPILTVWMEFNPVSFQGRGGQYIGGEQVNEAITHRFKCRHSSIQALGKEFGLGFNINFQFLSNLMPLKCDYFLLVQQGSTVKGRLFRIHNITNNKEEREYLNILAEEIEERGTGFPT